MQNNTSHNGIVEALRRHKENVVADENVLHKILFQIPEKKVFTVPEVRPHLRSPYVWMSVAQMVMVSCLLLAIYLPKIAATNTDPGDTEFYAVDKQIEAFEAGINNDEYNNLLIQ